MQMYQLHSDLEVISKYHTSIASKSFLNTVYRYYFPLSYLSISRADLHY